MIRVHLQLVVMSVFFYSIAGFSETNTIGLSQKRDPTVSYLSYVNSGRMYRIFDMGIKRWDSETDFGTPYEKSKPFSGEVVATTPISLKLTSDRELKSLFLKTRNERFLKDPEHESFLRRSSWLYPDDGCFARAELSRENISKWEKKSPNKIFVFGDLSVQTDNSSSGQVHWWYHVAPIVEMKKQLYVLDPAINPYRPLPAEEWLASMHTDTSSLSIAICASDSYHPGDSCENPKPSIYKAKLDQVQYLNFEWKRQIELKRNPEEVLGDEPPWLNSEQN